MSFYKSKLDTMLNKHYKYMVVVSNRIVQRNRKYKNEHMDLISEVTEFLYSKLHDPYIMEAIDDDKKFIHLTSKTMRNFKHWSNSTHNKSMRSTGNVICVDWEEPDYSIPIDIELNAEPTNKNTKVFIKELMNQSIPQSRAVEYIKIMNIKNTLPMNERYLFEQAFEQNKSSRTIASEVSRVGKMSYGTVNKMINNLRTKIKEQL